MGLLALLCFALAVVLTAVGIYLKEISPLKGWLKSLSISPLPWPSDSTSEGIGFTSF